MTSEKLKPTPGPWVVAPLTPNRVDTRSGAISISWSANHDGGQREREAEANARLIAEAGTVFHECGLSPRELLERCSAMEAALNACKDALEWVVEQGGGPVCEHEGGVVCFCKENNAINAASAALAKHKEI